jgi:glutamate-1-semialdehyde 2,1-aminomutase
MFSVFFSDDRVTDFAGAKAADHARYARFFHHLLERGVHLPPSGYELWSLCTELGPAEVDRIVEAAGSFEG